MTSPGGEAHDGSAFVILKQNGAEITGTGGPDESQQFPISKGKIEGNKITFEVQTDGPLYKLDLVLDGDHIKGEASMEHEGQLVKGKVDVTRLK